MDTPLTAGPADDAEKRVMRALLTRAILTLLFMPLLISGAAMPFSIMLVAGTALALDRLGLWTWDGGLVAMLAFAPAAIAVGLYALLLALRVVNTIRALRAPLVLVDGELTIRRRHGWVLDAGGNHYRLEPVEMRSAVHQARMTIGRVAPALRCCLAIAPHLATERDTERRQHALDIAMRTDSNARAKNANGVLTARQCRSLLEWRLAALAIIALFAVIVGWQVAVWAGCLAGLALGALALIDLRNTVRDVSGRKCLSVEGEASMQWGARGYQYVWVAGRKFSVPQDVACIFGRGGWDAAQRTGQRVRAHFAARSGVLFSIEHLGSIE